LHLNNLVEVLAELISEFIRKRGRPSKVHTLTEENCKEGFRVCSKKLFLIYPSCPIPLEVVVVDLIRLLAPYRIKDYIAYQKVSNENEVEIFVYISLHQRPDIRNPNYFDLKLIENFPQGGYLIKQFHGIYKGCRSESNIIKCIRKDLSFDKFLEAVVTEHIKISKNLLPTVKKWYKQKA